MVLFFPNKAAKCWQSAGIWRSLNPKKKQIIPRTWIALSRISKGSMCMWREDVAANVK